MAVIRSLSGGWTMAVLPEFWETCSLQQGRRMIDMCTAPGTMTLEVIRQLRTVVDDLEALQAEETPSLLAVRTLRGYTPEWQPTTKEWEKEAPKALKQIKKTVPKLLDYLKMRMED